MPITVSCTVSHINLFTFYRNWEFKDWISQVHQSIQSLISYYTLGPLMISTLTTCSYIGLQEVRVGDNLETTVIDSGIQK